MLIITKYVVNVKFRQKKGSRKHNFILFIMKVEKSSGTCMRAGMISTH